MARSGFTDLMRRKPGPGPGDDCIKLLPDNPPKTPHPPMLESGMDCCFFKERLGNWPTPQTWLPRASSHWYTLVIVHESRQ